MLKVTLHNSKPGRTSPNNLLGKLDIGYAKLNSMADYKAMMLSAGIGEHAPISLTDYPRWSASMWDLIARVICIGINRREAVWPADIPNARRGAYIENMTAIVEHWPDGFEIRRATIGTAHVEMCARRCNYVATFDDDMCGRQRSDVFRHTPVALTPWDLLARAFAQAFNGCFELPPRPRPYLPISVEHAGASYVVLDTLQLPARKAVERWLAYRRLATTTIDLVDGLCVTEAQFVEFLEHAV